MERLSKSAIPEFLGRRLFSVVHVDADWDGYRKAVADRIRAIQPQFGQTVSFGYVDSDAEQEYAAEIGLRNVPSVAYYRGAKLVGLVTGMQQDIVANIERLMSGEPLDEAKALSRGCPAPQQFVASCLRGHPRANAPADGLPSGRTRRP